MQQWFMDVLLAIEDADFVTVTILIVWFGGCGYVIGSWIWMKVQRWRARRSGRVVDLQDWVAEGGARPRW